MKIVTYKIEDGRERLGFYAHDRVYRMHKFMNMLPDSMTAFLEGGQPLMDIANSVYQSIIMSGPTGHYEKYAEIIAPVPRPASCRDGYAFRQHVAAARRNRGVPMIPEFDSFPIFYFTNHNAITGPGEIPCMPDHFQMLDFELEVAAVIGRKGRNIKAADADQYIAGYTIMNDMSARVLQMEEMQLSLGPAKGKDFATAIGPWLVTPDELSPYLVPPKHGHVGNNYNLDMRCRVNGIEVSAGNMADMDWTFAEIIERCSYGCDILPGDVIGSGTVGTGCFLELNGTGLLNDKDYKAQWLQPGDTIEMEITGLGKLVNQVTAVQSRHSLLKLKK